MITLGDRKSLHTLREMWVNLATNHRYQLFVDKKDIETFTTRTDNEGLHFLTKVLPTIGKALDNFHATKQWSALTEFSSELVSLNVEHCNLLGYDVTQQVPVPYFLRNGILQALRGDSEAVDCIRQLSLMFYKLEVDYDQDRKDEFLIEFERTDEDLALVDFEGVSPLIDRARGIIAWILSNEDPLDIRPCHGSGSTACRTPNHEKWSKLRYYRELDAVFSYPDYFFYSVSHLSDDLQKLTESVESNPQARVCLVPKDSRGPRVISCEPAELMFIQQGLMRKLYSILETHRLTRGQLNFADQSINRELAKEGSRTSAFATLDLSEASDRVSLELVRRLFPPNWFEALRACRSSSTVLPNGRVVELNKFAPMGSSCCFPVEALVFWAIAKAAIQPVYHGALRRSSRRNLRTEFLPPVWVYGDDIIVIAEYADTVMKGLESVGLVVNRHKSFVSGPFRESCGGAYHNGYDVTPVQIRHVPHESRTSLSTDVDFCNSVIAKFGYKESLSMVSTIESMYQVPFPRSLMQHPCCLNSETDASNDVFYLKRWNKSLQRVEHRIPQPYTPTLVRCQATWSELLRKELTRESRGHTDPDRYVNKLSVANSYLAPGEYAEGHSAQIKWRWCWLG